MNRSLRILVAGLAVVALAAGCGGGDGGGTTGGGGNNAGANNGGGNGATPDPCTLVTKDDAVAALGGPVSDAEATSNSEERVCRIRSEATRTRYVSVKVSPGNRAGFDFAYKSISDAIKGTEMVSGLGDAAFAHDSEATVLKGKFLTVYFIGGTERTPELRQRVLALAKAGTARL